MEHPSFNIDLVHPTTQKPFRVYVVFEGLSVDDLRKFYGPPDLTTIARSLAYPVQYAHMPEGLRRDLVARGEMLLKSDVQLTN